jgi:hypothetical protein
MAAFSPRRVQRKFVFKVSRHLGMCRTLPGVQIRYVVGRSTHIFCQIFLRNITAGSGNLVLAGCFLFFSTTPNQKQGVKTWWWMEALGMSCAVCPSLCYEMLVRPEAKTSFKTCKHLTTPIVLLFSFCLFLFYLDSLDGRCRCSMNTSLLQVRALVRIRWRMTARREIRHVSTNCLLSFAMYSICRVFAEWFWTFRVIE